MVEDLIGFACQYFSVVAVIAVAEKLTAIYSIRDRRGAGLLAAILLVMLLLLLALEPSHLAPPA